MNNNQTAGQGFKTLQIIHIALCLGVTLFLFVTLFLNYNHAHAAIQPNDSPLLYVAIVFAFGAVFVSNMLYRTQLAAIDLSQPASRKFAPFISACIVRYALIEGSALFNVVVWFLTGNLINAIAAALLIVYLVSLRPVKSNVVQTLQISYPDSLD